jgi:hypothetical protein
MAPIGNLDLVRKVPHANRLPFQIEHTKHRTHSEAQRISLRPVKHVRSTRTQLSGSISSSGINVSEATTIELS